MTSPISDPARELFAAFLTKGPSLLIATSSTAREPRLSRASAARLGADGRLTLAIPIPDGVGALEDVAATGAIALTAALPSTHVTFQAKGHDAHVTVWHDAPACVRAHEDAFLSEIEGVGLPRAVGRAFFSRRFVSVAFTVDALFEQTPGPHAGLRVDR